MTAAYRLPRTARRLATTTLAIALLGSASCAPTADELLRDVFDVQRPAHVRVEHYQASVLHPDGWEVWVLAPVDDALLRQMVDNAGLARAANTTADGGLVSGWPAWWQPAHLESLRELYVRDEDSRHIRVWVDRRRDRLYLQSFGT